MLRVYVIGVFFGLQWASAFASHYQSVTDEFIARAILGDLSDAQLIFSDPGSLSESEAGLSQQFQYRFIDRAEHAVPSTGDLLADEVLEIYRDYWTRVLMGDLTDQQGKDYLASALRKTLGGEVDVSNPGKPGAIYDRLVKALRARGFHVLEADAPPLRDLFLWKNEQSRKFSVRLTDSTEQVNVVLIEMTKSPDRPKNILAMVGAGHLVGMLPTFNNPPAPEALEELDVKPPPSKTGYYVGWGIGLFILSMFGVGYMRSPELGTELILQWFVINGGLSALGAALAFAHPVSILAAFLAAPLTSLNPTVGAGMVVGIVESYIRKPKVADFESMREDIAHFSKWWKNGVIRVFLIFFFANLGSAAGTFIAGSSIVYKIFGSGS